jgi:hypothetical protein
VNVPLLTVPVGALLAQVNSYRPQGGEAHDGVLVSEKSSVTELSGATAGKSNIAFGVPWIKLPAERDNVSSQFEVSLVMVYPQPTVEPASPETSPLAGISVCVFSLENAEFAESSRSNPIGTSMRLSDSFMSSSLRMEMLFAFERSQRLGVLPYGATACAIEKLYVFPGTSSTVPSSVRMNLVTLGGTLNVRVTLVVPPITTLPTDMGSDPR